MTQPTIPSGLCQCGCGGVTQVSTYTNNRYGYLKDKPRRFIQNHHWRGHYRHPNPKGYRTVIDHANSRSNSTGAVRAHVSIAERVLGKPLPPKAVIHHVDGDIANNATSNLVICENQSYHLLLHVRQRVQDAGGDPNTQRVCTICKELMSISSLYIRKTGPRAGSFVNGCRKCSLAIGRASHKRKRERQKRDVNQAD